MGVLNNSMWNVASASSNFYEYQIENSLRLNGTDQALEKTFSDSIIFGGPHTYITLFCNFFIVNIFFKASNKLPLIPFVPLSVEI